MSAHPLKPGSGPVELVTLVRQHVEALARLRVANGEDIRATSATHQAYAIPWPRAARNGAWRDHLLFQKLAP